CRRNRDFAGTVFCAGTGFCAGTETASSLVVVRSEAPAPLAGPMCPGAAMIQIKHKATGAVLHSFDAESLECLKLTGIKLYGASLRGLCFRELDLSNSDLRETDLRE